MEPKPEGSDPLNDPSKTLSIGVYLDLDDFLAMRPTSGPLMDSKLGLDAKGGHMQRQHHDYLWKCREDMPT